MIPEEDLRRMYLDERMNTYQIAKVIGVSYGTIRNWIKSYDIPMRTKSEAFFSHDINIPTKEKLHNIYWVKNINTIEIGKLFNVSDATVRNWMESYNIPRRTKSEAMIGCDTIVPTKEELYQMYWDKKMSQQEIAKEVGVDQGTIHHWMKSYNIPSRTLSESGLLKDNKGPKHHLWKGGRKAMKYCYKFNDRLKEAVRKRDNYTCQNCGKIQEEDIRKLAIHHVHYDAENCYPDLICLCTGCHASSNNNRNWWETHCMCILADRGLLGWKPPWSE